MFSALFTPLPTCHTEKRQLIIQAFTFTILPIIGFNNFTNCCNNTPDNKIVAIVHNPTLPPNNAPPRTHIISKTILTF